jgi:hypothetical protein
MFSEIYIETLLVDEETADAVCEARAKREIDDGFAAIARTLIAASNDGA